MLRRIFYRAFLALLMLLVLGSAGWGLLALRFAGLQGTSDMRFMALFGIAAVAGLIGVAWPRWRLQLLAIYGLSFVMLLVWFLGIKPSNERDWQIDAAILPYATMEGTQVTLHNVRNFDYRTETDYTPGYYDKRFDLRKLQGMDLIAVYWMGPAIAHTFVSFEFAGGEHLAISIETRKRKGDEYSTLRGFFRQYELYYVVADERDVIRLRTNYRHDPSEQVYIYRVNGEIADGRRLFQKYMYQINALRDQPEFYNTLTSNCTTDIWANTLVNANHLPLSWQVLASGYLPQYLYENGRLDNSVSFHQLQRRGHVNERALAADKAQEFSALIRKIEVPIANRPTRNQ